MKYYKAVREDGTDFRTGRVNYAAALTRGDTVSHARPRRRSEDASDYLSLSITPGDCTGFSWPARLLEVKPVGAAWTPHKHELPNKRAAVAVTIVQELPAHLLFGPQGEAVVALLNEVKTMTPAKRSALYSARPIGWWDAYYRAYRDGLARRVGLVAARGALGDRLSGWGGDDAAYGAALAVLLRHTIGTKGGLTQKEYDLLATPWLKVTGKKLHPEDAVF